MSLILGFAIGGIFMWFINQSEIDTLYDRLEAKDDYTDSLETLLSYEKTHSEQLRELLKKG